MHPTLESLDARLTALEQAKKGGSFEWIAPYLPSIKSTLISVVSMLVGASGGYVAAPEKARTVEVPVVVPQKDAPKVEPKTSTIRPAGDVK